MIDLAATFGVPLTYLLPVGGLCVFVVLTFLLKSLFEQQDLSYEATMSRRRSKKPEYKTKDKKKDLKNVATKSSKKTNRADSLSDKVTDDANVATEAQAVLQPSNQSHVTTSTETVMDGFEEDASQKADSGTVQEVSVESVSVRQPPIMQQATDQAVNVCETIQALDQYFTSTAVNQAVQTSVIATSASTQTSTATPPAEKSYERPPSQSQKKAKLSKILDNSASLTDLVSRANLDPVQVQELINILLNKQGDALPGDDHRGQWQGHGGQSTVCRLEREIVAREKTLSDQEQSISNLNARLVELRSELTDSQRRLKAKDAELITLQTGMASKTGELEQKFNSDLAAKVKAVKSENDGRLHSAAETISVLQAQLEERTKLDDQHQAEWDLMRTKYESEIRQQRRQLEVQQNQEDQHINRIKTPLESQIASQAASLQQQQNELTSGQAQIRSLINRVQELEVLNQRLSTDFAELHSVHQQKVDSLRETDSLVKQLTTDKGQLEYSLAEARGQLKLAEESAQRHLDEVTAHQGTTEQALQSVITERDRMSGDLAAVRAELQSSQATIDSLQTENVALKDKAGQIQAEHVCEMNDLASEVARVKAELADMATEQEDGRSRDEETRASELVQMVAERDDCKKHAEELQETVTSLQSELDLQRTKNDELRQKNWTVVQALNEAEKRANEATIHMGQNGHDQLNGGDDDAYEATLASLKMSHASELAELKTDLTSVQGQLVAEKESSSALANKLMKCELLLQETDIALRSEREHVSRLLGDTKNVASKNGDESENSKANDLADGVEDGEIMDSIEDISNLSLSASETSVENGSLTRSPLTKNGGAKRVKKLFAAMMK